jgi:hypothetical protein
MKNTLLILICLFSLKHQAQVCSDQGTSTNPDDPNAPTAPANDPDLWLNSFNWYANDGYTLHIIQLEERIARLEALLLSSKN